MARKVAEAWDNKAIAGQLGLTVKATECHVERIAAKLGYLPGMGYSPRIVVARWGFEHTPAPRERNT